MQYNKSESDCHPGHGVLYKKSKDEALRLKTLGNLEFKAHRDSRALHYYTQALLVAPYSTEVKREVLQLLERAKYKVVQHLYKNTDKSVEAMEKDPLLSRCFGNRSAVLYGMKKYTECISDIEQALLLGFPADSAHKLHSRRAKCLAALVGVSNHSESSEGTTVDCSAYQSDLVTVLSDPELGRHTTAAKDIHPGEILISEESFASVLDFKFLTTHCSYCFKRSPFSILPCVMCASQSYCSFACREQAWVKYHWLECDVVNNNWRKNADWMEVLSLRIVLSADTSEMLSAITDEYKSQAFEGSYGFIYSLESHQDKFSNGSQKDAFLKVAGRLTQRFGKYILSFIFPRASSIWESSEEEIETEYGSELASLERLFLRHMLQLRCNSHAVSEVVSELDRAVDNGHGSVETLSEVRVGTVLLPTASLVNHSCSPNSVFRFNGSKVRVCATKHVNEGEEISTSYGAHVGRIKTAQRKQELRERYFFDCRCEACGGSNPNLLLAEAAVEGLSCQRCDTGALVGETGDSCYVCCHCKARLSGKHLSGLLEIKRKSEVLFEDATTTGVKGDVDALSLSLFLSLPLPLSLPFSKFSFFLLVSLDSLLECRKMQESVLHRYNRDLAKTNDMIAQKYASQGDFILSGKFLEQSCLSVCTVYGEQSIEFANELHKMAQVQFHSGQMERALKTAKQARVLIAIYHGCHHQDCKELDEMIKTLNSQ